MMRQLTVWFRVACAAAVLGALSTLPSSAGATTTPEWGPVRPAVFSDGVQSPNPYGQLMGISCTSTGNCTAVGRFMTADGNVEAFTMTSTNGTWGNGTRVTFPDGLQHANPDDSLGYVSCTSAGNCTALGSFLNAGGIEEMFVVSSTAGTWGNATRITFPANTQHTSRSVYAHALSCASAGNCTAVGGFLNAGGTELEAFTVTSVAGTWATAAPAVFPSSTQNATKNATFNSVSCASAGNCTAVGKFKNTAGGFEAFTMSSTNGTWGTAIPAFFPANTQNSTPDANFNSVSCASAGNCTAVGKFKNTTGADEAFTMTSTNGTWGTATRVVFPASAQSVGLEDVLMDVSCASAGNCTAVGQFRNAPTGRVVFTMTSISGTWGEPTPVTFPANTLNTDLNADRFYNFLYSVSCASAGNCTAVGQFKNVALDSEAFTVTSTNGTWSSARPVVFPSGSQNTNPDAELGEVTCSSAGNCTAVGKFKNSAGDQEGFTLTSTYTPPPPSTTVAPTTTVALAPSTTAAPTLAPTTTIPTLRSKTARLSVQSPMTARQVAGLYKLSKKSNYQLAPQGSSKVCKVSKRRVLPLRTGICKLTLQVGKTATKYQVQIRVVKP